LRNSRVKKPKKFVPIFNTQGRKHTDSLQFQAPQTRLIDGIVK